MKLTKLMNADGETVGYFSDYGVEMAARQEWAEHYGNKLLEAGKRLSIAGMAAKCRSHEVAIVSTYFEDVEPGDSDRFDHLMFKLGDGISSNFSLVLGCRVHDWTMRGAIAVEVQRFLINKYRRPGMSARDSDLGGPVDADGVLYILKIKAPK